MNRLLSWLGGLVVILLLTNSIQGQDYYSRFRTPPFLPSANLSTVTVVNPAQNGKALKMPGAKDNGNLLNVSPIYPAQTLPVNAYYPNPDYPYSRPNYYVPLYNPYYYGRGYRYGLNRVYWYR